MATGALQRGWSDFNQSYLKLNFLELHGQNELHQSIFINVYMVQGLYSATWLRAWLRTAWLQSRSGLGQLCLNMNFIRLQCIYSYAYDMTYSSDVWLPVALLLGIYDFDELCLNKNFVEMHDHI